MASDSEIFAKMAEFIAERNGTDVSEISMDTAFADLNLDSLDIEEMLLYLEEELGIEIEADDPDADISTVGAIVRIIEDKHV